MRLDVIGLITVTLAGLLCVNGNINPGIAGLVLVYALDITKYLKFGTSMVRCFCFCFIYFLLFSAVSNRSKKTVHLNCVLFSFIIPDIIFFSRGQRH